MTVLRILARC